MNYYYHTNSGLHIYVVGDDDGDDGDDDEDLFLSLASKFPRFSFLLLAHHT